MSQLKSSVSKMPGSGREEAARPVAALPVRIQAAVGVRRGPGLPDGARRRAAVAILLDPPLVVAEHLDAHPRRERVDDADAHAVEAARDLVAAAAELPAGVEHGVHHLEGVLARGVLADRDPAPVVDHLDLPVGVNRDVHARRDAGHRLVDAVVHELPDELMEAAGVRGPDVHARALTDGLEALQHLDVGGRVSRLGLASARFARGLHGHARSTTCCSSSLADVSTGIEAATPPPTPRLMIE